jgi:hypothetical protein
MADANVVLAVARGIRPPQIYGAVASARAEVNQLVSSGQIADKRLFILLGAANALQSPNGLDVYA